MHNSQRTRNMYEKANGLFPTGKPRLSFLRQEVTLNNQQGQVTFDFNENVAGSPTDRKLSIKDAVLIESLGVFLVVEQINRPGSGVLLTHPNPSALAPAFAAAASGVPTTPEQLVIDQAARDLEAFFNGRLALKIDQDIVFDGVDTRRCRYVPQTQQSAINDKQQGDYSDGLIAIEPNPVLIGSRNNLFTVSVPIFPGVTPTWAATNAAWAVKLVLAASVFHVPGGAGLYKS